MEELQRELAGAKEEYYLLLDSKEKCDEILRLIGGGPDRYGCAPVEFPGLRQAGARWTRALEAYTEAIREEK